MISFARRLINRSACLHFRSLKVSHSPALNTNFSKEKKTRIVLNNEKLNFAFR